MKIGLIDVDSHNFPNLALMKISAWHKAQGDHVEWYQPMFSGHMDRVYMSKVFTFSDDYEWCIDADEVIKGGTGYAVELKDGREQYDKSKDNPLPEEVEHIYPDYSIYGITDTAYGFLTRGCPRGCDFCHVAGKEGKCSYKVADLSEFWNGQKNIVLCDPNILACPDHMDLLQQVVDSKAKVEFNQGLDVRLINDRNLELIKQIPMKYIHFAYDNIKDREIIEPRLKAFKEATGYNHRKVMVYILVNFESTLEEDLHRIYFCRELDFDPFVMVYDKAHCDPIYKKLQRWCNTILFFGRYQHLRNTVHKEGTWKRGKYMMFGATESANNANIITHTQAVADIFLKPGRFAQWQMEREGCRRGSVTSLLQARLTQPQEGRHFAMGNYDLRGLVGTEIVEHTVMTEGIMGRACKNTKWTVVETYPHFVKAMRITESGNEIYTTFNTGTLITMGVIQQKGVRYIG